MNCSSTLGDENAVKCELAGEVVSSSGSLRLCVTGWSMLPSVWPGDTLIVERIHGDAVCPGDIVLFRRDRRLFAHRVIASPAGVASILTRGDSMPGADPPVLKNDLLGRVSFIQRDGKLIQPARRLRFSQLAIAALMQHSDFAARVLVGFRGLRRTIRTRNQGQIQTSTVQTAVSTE